jgi:hypothetical protein
VYLRNICNFVYGDGGCFDYCGLVCALAEYCARFLKFYLAEQYGVRTLYWFLWRDGFSLYYICCYLCVRVLGGLSGLPWLFALRRSLGRGGCIICYLTAGRGGIFYNSHGVVLGRLWWRLGEVDKV